MTSGGVIHRTDAGAALRILLGERDCDGSMGAVEMEFAPGDHGPPLHVHPTHAEAFYVLAGELCLQVGDEVIVGGPGTWACAPKNVAHALANLGTAPGRVLCLFAPGGFERRFERLLAQQRGETIGADLAELNESEELTRIVGPPIRSQPEISG
jgi:quercetin dioxygenase-like cupin family protein